MSLLDKFDAVSLRRQLQEETQRREQAEEAIRVLRDEKSRLFATYRQAERERDEARDALRAFTTLPKQFYLGAPALPGGGYDHALALVTREWFKCVLAAIAGAHAALVSEEKTR